MTERLANWTHSLDGWGGGRAAAAGVQLSVPCWGLVAPCTQAASSSRVVARSAHLNVNILIFQVLATNLSIFFFYCFAGQRKHIWQHTARGPRCESSPKCSEGLPGSELAAGGIVHNRAPPSRGLLGLRSHPGQAPVHRRPSFPECSEPQSLYLRPCFSAGG